MDELLNTLLPFAQQMIEEHGEFYPAGAAMTTDGQVGLEAADTGSEMPVSSELIELLTGGLRQRAESGELRAAAIVANVTVNMDEGGTTDAVQVAMEHRDADPITVLMRYSKKRLRGWEFGELVATPGGRAIFA